MPGSIQLTTRSMCISSEELLDMPLTPGLATLTSIQLLNLSKLGRKSTFLPTRYDVQANAWTTVGQMSDGNHWSTHGNLRAGDKFYLEAAERGNLARFDPATETYTVINTV